jgi:hypothetical protein
VCRYLLRSLYLVGGSRVPVLSVWLAMACCLSVCLVSLIGNDCMPVPVYLAGSGHVLASVYLVGNGHTPVAVVRRSGLTVLRGPLVDIICRLSAACMRILRLNMGSILVIAGTPSAMAGGGNKRVTFAHLPCTKFTCGCAEGDMHP